jgi:hypothetical protein
MSLSKKIDLYKDFAVGVYLSKAHNYIPPPPKHTVRYTCIQYTYSHREGDVGGGGELNKREG